MAVTEAATVEIAVDEVVAPEGADVAANRAANRATSRLAAAPEVAVKAVTGAQSTQTFPLVSGRGARCTSNGGGGVSFVVNPPPAPGRTSTLPSLKNEILTSSVLLK